MAVQSLLLEIKLEDILNAKRDGECPACVALTRTIGSAWRRVGCFMMVEALSPFRLVFLPTELQVELEKFAALGEMKPFTTALILRQRPTSSVPYNWQTGDDFGVSPGSLKPSCEKTVHGKPSISGALAVAKKTP